MSRLYLSILVVVLVIAVIGGVIFYFVKGSGAPSLTSSSEEEIAALISKVSELIVLPSGEAPTIATVTNPDLLRVQPFFANAKTGDKVLIYTAARKAILYSPESNKIVEVAPINFETAPTGGR